MTITKKDLVERIAGATAEKQSLVRTVVQELLGEIAAELGKGNRIELRDFGVLETRISLPRMAQNPKTLERFQVPAKRRVVFKPGRRMREGLNGHAEHETLVSQHAGR